MSQLKSLRNYISSNPAAKSAIQKSIACEWSQFEILARMFELRPSLKVDVTLCLPHSGLSPSTGSLCPAAETHEDPPNRKGQEGKEEREGTFYSIEL